MTELTRDLTRETGFEAVMRLRCSKGMKVSAFYGNFHMRGTDLMALPNVDVDKAFACELTFEEQAISTNAICVQCALLYTTSGGERRIRVHTINLPVTTQMVDLYNWVDAEAMANLEARIAVDTFASGKMNDARLKVQERCTVALRGFKAGCQPDANAVPLFPPAADLVPLYSLSMLKHAILRPGADTSSDERIWYHHQIMMMGSKETALLFYPKCYSLHNLPPTAGLQNASGAIEMPRPMPLAIERLEADGIFLAYDGLSLYLILGRNAIAQPALLQQVLGDMPIDRFDGQRIILPQLQSELSFKINNIIAHLKKRSRHSVPPLTLVRQGGPAEVRITGMMVEDRSMHTMAYVEFLQYLSRQAYVSPSAQ